MEMQFEEQSVRIVKDENGEPWFVAKDVCDVLTLGNSRDATSRLDDDEKADVGITDGRQERLMVIVNESGLYSLIIRSNKTEAKKFKRWITHDVLPSIRKTGGYGIPQTLPEALRAYALSLEKKRRRYDIKANGSSGGV